MIGQALKVILQTLKMVLWALKTILSDHKMPARCLKMTPWLHKMTAGHRKTAARHGGRMIEAKESLRDIRRWQVNIHPRLRRAEEGNFSIAQRLRGIWPGDNGGGKCLPAAGSDQLQSRRI